MKIGIALGGGGAKGFAHIGVLKTLEQAGIPIAAVAGTSIGALVGAAYIAGKLTELEQFAVKLKLTDVARLLSPTWSVSGMFSGNNALARLDQFLPSEPIEKLSRPFAAVAVDLARGERVVFTKGDLRHALRCSFSIPGIFTPVLSESADRPKHQVVVDGGLIDPVPVSVCRSLGADFVIAVDLFGNYQQLDSAVASTSGEQLWKAGLKAASDYLRTFSAMLPLGERLFPAEKEVRRSLNIIEITERSLAVMQRELTAYRLSQDPADLIIAPPTAGYTLLDFHHASPLIEEAAELTRAMIPSIRKVLAGA